MTWHKLVLNDAWAGPGGVVEDISDSTFGLGETWQIFVHPSGDDVYREWMSIPARLPARLKG